MLRRVDALIVRTTELTGDRRSLELAASDALLVQCDEAEEAALVLSGVRDQVTEATADALVPVLELMADSLKIRLDQLAWSLAGEGF